MSGTFSGNYLLKFGRVPFNGFLRADYSFRSSVQWSQLNTPNTIESPYGLLGASIGIRDKAGHYSLTLFGKNLTDKFHTGGSGLYSDGVGYSVYQTLGPDYKRLWGARLEYEF
jgi:iron complex outermembrane receptor protein